MIRHTPSEFQERLKKIKCLALDVDGILTDAKVFWVEGQGWTRSYCIRDGYGMKLLRQIKLPVAIITGGDSPDLHERAKALGVEHVYTGNEDKIHAYEALKKKLNLKDHDMAYMGDDLFDLPILERVGFSATVPEAIPQVVNTVDYVTQRSGGNGAVREIIDHILASRA